MTEAIVSLVFALAILVGIVLLGGVPGHIARKNHHPQASMIHTLGLVGIIVWPVWIGALIWACLQHERQA